jgi:hypothetical protein
MKGASFILIRAIKENHGMIGQWFIFEETNNVGDIVENNYPSRLLGFITTNSTQEAVILDKEFDKLLSSLELRLLDEELGKDNEDENSFENLEEESAIDP